MANKSSMKLKSRKGLRFGGPGGPGRPTEVQKAVKEQQRKQFNELAPEIIAAYDLRVKNWVDAKPTFRKVVRDLGADKPISLFIHTVGSAHARNTFELIDSEGRPGGITITAKPGNVMKFKQKYFGKTAPGDIYGKRRSRRGLWQSRKTVIQGPIEPRGFSKAIRKEFLPDFRNAARRGLCAGLKMATGVGCT